MKGTKFFLCAVLGLAGLTSCNKSTPGPSQFYQARDGEIFFSSNGLVVSTKAVTESDDSKLQANGFNVAVCIDNAASNVMFNKKVTYESGIWKVSGATYYYPFDDTISAYAVYPTSETVTTDASGASIAYTQDARKDLVAASETNIARQSAAVNLSFRHILAQVKVKCQGSDPNADYVLKTIELKAPCGGTYLFSNDSWTELGDATSYTYYNNVGESVSTSEMQSFGESMTFIPSTVDIRAVWYCKNKIDRTVVGTYDQSVEVKLSAGNLSTLKLKLPNSNAREIDFSVNVEPWDTDEQELEMKESVAVRTLPGVFTVDSQGHTVHFTAGNLFWNGDKFGLEEHQYDHASEKQPSYVGHFYFSKDAAIAIADGYDDPSAADNDVLFAADGGIFDGYTVLSDEQWSYIIEHSLYTYFDGANECNSCAVKVAGVDCAILKPDGFSGTVRKSYTTEQWVEAEAQGLVALPFAGWLECGMNEISSGGAFYWSSTCYGEYDAYEASFYDNIFEVECEEGRDRDWGYCIRLVTIAE